MLRILCLLLRRKQTLFFLLASCDPQRLELAVQVVRSGRFSRPRARSSAFVREQLFEIGAFERFARLAQRQLAAAVPARRKRMELRRHPLHIGRADFLLQR
jgi:hypothetical protein